MKKIGIGLIVGLVVCTFTVVGLCEPTVTSSGSMQVIGSTGSKGQSSFRSEFDLTMEVNFTDYISGVIQTQGVTSHSGSAMDVRQGFLMVGNLNGTNKTESKTGITPLADEFFKDPALIDKMIAKANLFSLPNKETTVLVAGETLKTDSTHDMILADLKNSLLLHLETEQPHTVEPMRLAKN